METEINDRDSQMMSDLEQIECLIRTEELESQSPANISQKLYIDIEKNEECSSEDSSIYSPIRPENIRILDLHVDHELKQSYLLNNKSCIWLGNDNSTEEKKLKGIITCLSNEVKEGKDMSNGAELTRTMSYEHIRHMDVTAQSYKRGSVDITYGRKQFKVDMTESNDGLESSQQGDEVSDVRDGNDFDFSKARIIDELEFQTSLKNERCHFMFADMLIESLEAMYSEEYYYQNRHGHNYKVGATLTLTKTDIDNDNDIDKSRDGPEPGTTSRECIIDSRAKSVSASFVEHIMSILSELTAHDGRRRKIPESLKRLCDKLEESSFLSVSLDMFRSQRMSSDKQIRSSKFSGGMFQNDSVSEDMDKIKTVMCSYSLDLQVGGYPVLGPDMSLPSYIASRSPPDSKRTATLFLQQNRCPGCKCAFLPEIALRLRLCRYFGLYFCSVCHSNTLMLIPARILTKWDFSMFPVSRPARDFLHLVHNVPVFSSSHFSKTLQSSLRVLNSVCRLRRQGRLLLDFIATCRQGSQLMSLTFNIPSHWLSDPPLLFSIADFQLMECGTMELNVKEVVSKYIEHISLCPLCQARGFFCELCDKSSEIIFSFEIDLVSQCAHCGACFHSRCFTKSMSACPRCERRRIREQRAHQSASFDFINTE